MLLATLLLAGAAHAQVHRCQGADGKISFSDIPCPGAVVAPAPAASATQPVPAANRPLVVAPSAAKNSKQAADEFHRIPQDNPKPEVHAIKKRECDAGNAQACAEWDRLERAYMKSLTQKLAPAAQNVNKHLRDECRSGNKNSCESACPTAYANEERHETQFLLQCAKVLARDHGSFWLVSKGAVRDKTPVELKYARKMPKGAILEDDLEVLCFRKRVSATEAQIDAFSVKQTFAVDNASGAVSGHAFWTTRQFGVFPREELKPKFPSLEEWANQSCPR